MSKSTVCIKQIDSRIQKLFKKQIESQNYQADLYELNSFFNEMSEDEKLISLNWLAGRLVDQMTLVFKNSKN